MLYSIIKYTVPSRLKGLVHVDELELVLETFYSALVADHMGTAYVSVVVWLGCGWLAVNG